VGPRCLHPGIFVQRSVLDLLPAPPGHRFPAWRGLVRRPQLFERLSATPAGGVIVVSGPPGSGKTALVGSWLEAAGLRDRMAWVSIERGERDGQRFWLSVIDALAGAVGEDAPVARVSPAPALRGEFVVERLLADLESLERPVVLVLDDLHELESADALASLELFLARLPAQARVVLVTRADPALGLHRLRLAGALTELRAPALRFSREETRELMEGAGVTLSDADLALLHDRTEGWAAGLRLAAISLVEHPDPERFVREFSGSERTVAGYLLAEVLERQPPEVRDLLLRTAVLERVSGALADFLTGGSGSERMLQELADANAFVTALDVGRSWFRYHDLFADLLRLELRRLHPALIEPLHRAAAQWLEDHGDVVEAVRHAQAAEDWPHAARLLADSCLGLILDGRTATVRGLLAAFPPDAVEAYPELAVAFAKSRLHDGRLDESAAYIAAAERLTATAPEERRQRLGLPLAEARLALARRRGDLGTVLEAMQCLEAALQAQPPSEAPDNDVRAAAQMNLGIAELWSLRVDDARRDLEQALALAGRIERPYLAIGCLAHLGFAAPLRGVPASEALELSDLAISIAEGHGWGADPVVAAAHAVSGLELVWLGRFREAEERLDRAHRALRPDGEPGTELIVHHARGLVRSTQGRLPDALAAFRAAQRMQALLASEHPLTNELRNRIAQTQVRMGETAAARAALARMDAEERARADIRIAAATMDLAQGDPQAAVERLGPVIEFTAPVLHATWAAIEASLLDAAARERLGDRRAAEVSIERALELAEPEGIILPFALAPVCRLLERQSGHRTAHATLLTTILDVLAGASPQCHARPLREPLSDAELRVVRYLPSNLTATEIARELCVSPNTVRTHLRHVYAKLDAHDRTEAVTRARQTGLLGSVPRLR
jgi:LuxR family transcriptional regulator, maltose regulon positive regulatory protein